MDSPSSLTSSTLLMVRQGTSTRTVKCTTTLFNDDKGREHTCVKRLVVWSGVHTILVVQWMNERGNRGRRCTKSRLVSDSVGSEGRTPMGSVDRDCEGPGGISAWTIASLLLESLSKIESQLSEQGAARQRAIASQYNIAIMRADETHENRRLLCCINPSLLKHPRLVRFSSFKGRSDSRAER